MLLPIELDDCRGRGYPSWVSLAARYMFASDLSNSSTALPCLQRLYITIRTTPPSLPHTEQSQPSINPSTIHYVWEKKVVDYYAIPSRPRPVFVILSALIGIPSQRSSITISLVWLASAPRLFLTIGFSPN